MLFEKNETLEKIPCFRRLFSNFVEIRVSLEVLDPCGRRTTTTSFSRYGLTSCKHSSSSSSRINQMRGSPRIKGLKLTRELDAVMRLIANFTDTNVDIVVFRRARATTRSNTHRSTVYIRYFIVIRAEYKYTL